MISTLAAPAEDQGSILSAHTGLTIIRNSSTRGSNAPSGQNSDSSKYGAHVRAARAVLGPSSVLCPPHHQKIQKIQPIYSHTLGMVPGPPDVLGFDAPVPSSK